jgi:hypothetical protein
MFVLPPARLRATLERAQRLTVDYVDTVIASFSGPAVVLGNALGIEPERVQVVLIGMHNRIFGPYLACTLGYLVPILNAQHSLSCVAFLSASPTWDL